MALKKEALQRIAALAKIKVEDLETAIKAETETDIAIDEKLTTFTEDEVTTIKTNEYKKGQTASVELAVKDAKEKLGLDFQGKTVDGLLEAHSKKVLADAKIVPDEKVKDLNEKVANLQKTVTEQEAKLKEAENEVSGAKINSELYKHIPAPGENGPALGQDDIIQLMRANGYEFKLEDGKMVAYKNGTQVVDKLSNPVAAKDVVSSFLTEKKLLAVEPAVPGGRGGNDQKPVATATKLSELKKSFEAQGKSLLGSEFSEAVAKAAKDNKDFKMDE